LELVALVTTMEPLPPPMETAPETTRLTLSEIVRVLLFSETLVAE
jgi:hypothetical protein